MEWLDRLKESLDYLETNLAGEIDIDTAARIACCSSYHYQRMFGYITGVTLAEYIRRRRLTMAAVELQCTLERVIDIALKYGYESPDAFTRAFQKLHGVTPSAAREPGVILKAYPPISFHISIRGDQDMNYKIVDQPGFKLVGKTIQVSTQDGENYIKIPQFWAQCAKDGTFAELNKVAAQTLTIGPQGTLIGSCLNYNPQTHIFTYLIGTETDLEQAPPGLDLVEIPPMAWAVFESVGAMPEAIQNLNKRIYSEWFPTTGYQRDGEYDMEVYPWGDTTSPDYRCEVWIAVKAK